MKTEVDPSRGSGRSRGDRIDHRNRVVGYVLLCILLMTGLARSQDLSESRTNLASAKHVIGQADFSGSECNQGGAPAANTLCQSSSLFGFGATGGPGFAKQVLFGKRVLLKNVLFVPDAQNNRVLAFKAIPKANDASAMFVLGQDKFSDHFPGLLDRGFDKPGRVVASGNQLFVYDTEDGRVLIWNALPFGTAALPDVVVGKPNFDTTGISPPTQSLIDDQDAGQSGMFVVNGKLLVSDSFHDRTLIWNTIPTVNGAPADVVLGQSDFTSGGFATSQSGLFDPQGIWSDGTRLVIADTGNSRVLIWNSFPTTNGAPADVVVGQPDFVSNGRPNPPTSQSLSYPFDVASDGHRLFVDEAGNNRVLVYSPFPTADNPAATVVLGQPDFEHGLENAGAGSPSARTLNDPTGLALVGKQLFVNDSGNNRFLIFNVH